MTDLVINQFPQRGAGGRAFDKPTLIPEIPAAPESFRSLTDLAKAIHRRRKRRGVELERAVAAWNGSDTFPAFNVYFVGETGGRDYAFTVYALGASRDAFMAVIAEANPDQPRRAA